MTRSAPTKARCPLCARRVAVFWHGRLIYVHHRVTRRSATVCDGSGWLVEDEEIAA